MTRRQCILVDLGKLDYLSALAEQERYWQQVVSHSNAASSSRELTLGYLLVVEHPPTITLGRRAKLSDIRFTSEQLTKQKIAVAKIGRGGVATFHAPGQIVIYPIVPLRHWRLSVKQFVNAMERAMARTAQAFGLLAIAGSQHQRPVGTWVGDAKIGAIGIQIKRGVSLHGLALNVTTDLTGFSAIDPCGLGDRSVTSMLHCCQVANLALPELPKVRQRLIDLLALELDARFTSP